ncbi:MAG: double zinc ribbon domain-containing protein [Gaiellaceae bacterium]
MSLLDLVLPLRCVACGEPGATICARCRGELPRLLPPCCARCGAPTAWPVARCRECAGRRIAFAQARAALRYAGRVPAIVAAWKERGLRRLADELAGVVVELVPAPRVELVTFAPPQPDRLLSRGHHPARRLAEALAERWELPLEPLLVRLGSPRRQRGLALEERRRNAAGAYRAAAVPARRICLVDDVYTTGATVNACASALRKAGARQVEVVTLARAVRYR